MWLAIRSRTAPRSDGMGRNGSDRVSTGKTTLGCGMSDEEQVRISRACNPITMAPETTPGSLSLNVALSVAKRHGAAWMTEGSLETLVREIERQQAELTFWRDGLLPSEVADNMKLWEMRRG